MTNHFCVLTTGRAGSTSLMQALAQYADIAVPAKQCDCPANEIFRVREPKRYWADYTRLSGIAVDDELSLARAFYRSSKGFRYAGFKTMPNRHRRLGDVLKDNQVSVICLTRDDLASTIASFIVATARRVWVRNGEPQTYRIRYTAALNRRIDKHLAYLLRARAVVASIRAPVKLRFEDLCDPAFEASELDAYFDRPVRLQAPQPPVSGASYVEDWPAFKRYVARRSRELRRHIAVAKPGL